MSTAGITALLMFVRWPEPGRTKTRLAASIGEQQAADLYRVMVEDLAARLRAGAEKNQYRLWYYATPVEQLGRVAFWLNDFKPPVVDAIPQPETGLAGRLEHAFETGFKPLAAEKVIVIGTDCPDVSPELVRQAALLLDSHEAVMGRAHDGGFYLFGTRSYIQGLFDGLEFSTPSAAEGLAAAVRRRGAVINTESLPVLADIDTADDLAAISLQSHERLVSRAGQSGLDIPVLGDTE